MQNALRFQMKKTSFFSIDKYFLSLFLKNQKLFLKETKLFFYIRNLRAFCIYFLQVLPSKSEGILPLDGNVLEIALQLYSAFRFERLKRIHHFKNQGQ